MAIRRHRFGRNGALVPVARYLEDDLTPVQHYIEIFARNGHPEAEEEKKDVCQKR